MHRSPRLTAIAILLATALPAFAADWPQWLGPGRNGASSENVEPWTDVPASIWKKEVGNAYSSPVVADGVVYVHAVSSKKDSEDVFAFDAQMGTPLWTDTYSRAVFRSMLGTGPRTTPTVADGKLFTYGITGVLSCYDAKTGKRLWQTYETYKGAMPRFGVCASPVVVGSKVIVMVGGGGSAAVAYDVATGNLAWKVLDEPAGSASPIVLTRGQGDQSHKEVVVQTTLRTVALSPEDGSVLWEHPLVFQPSGVSPTPLFLDNTLICTTQDTGTLALSLAAGTGSNPTSPWWKQDVTSYFSTGAPGPKGSVLVITNQLQPLPRTDVRCLDLARGDELWHREGMGYFHVGIIALANNRLLALSDGGTLTLAEITREGFKELAKAKVCRGTLCNPALSNGKLYVRDDKEVTCLQLPGK